MTNDKKIIVALAIPTYGNIAGNFFDFYHNLLIEFSKHGIYYMKLHYHGDSLITRARNYLLAEYYYYSKQYPLTHLLFLDSDISVDPSAICRMILDSMEEDIDVIGGYIPIKEFINDTSRQPVGYIHTHDFNISEKVWVNRGKKLQKVDYLTTGLIALKTKVVRALIKDAKIKKQWYHHELPIGTIRVFDIFKCEIRHKLCKGKMLPIYLSEDWYLCELLNELNFDVIADMRMAITHRGHYDYKFLSLDSEEEK